MVAAEAGDGEEELVGVEGDGEQYKEYTWAGQTCTMSLWFWWLQQRSKQGDGEGEWWTWRGTESSTMRTPGHDRHASLVCDSDDCSRGRVGRKRQWTWRETESSIRSTPGRDRHASLVCDCDDCSRGRGMGRKNQWTWRGTESSMRSTPGRDRHAFEPPQCWREALQVGYLFLQIWCPKLWLSKDCFCDVAHLHCC